MHHYPPVLPVENVPIDDVLSQISLYGLNTPSPIDPVPADYRFVQRLHQPLV